MTTLVCDFIDIIGEPIDGVASLSTGEVRPDFPGRSVKVPHPVSETVVAGQATFNNVRPGKAVLTVHWEGRSATFRFTVPNTESIALIDAVAGIGLEQSELDEFRAGIAAEFSNTREIVIEAAADAQAAAADAAASAAEAYTAVDTAASGAIQEVHDAVAADRALIEGYKNSAAESATTAQQAAAEAEAAVGTAAADAAASVRSELDAQVSAAEAAAAQAEQHEAGAAAAAAHEVSKLKGDAPEAFDTLGEIAAELAANETERSALANSIAAKADKSHDHTIEEVTGLETALDGKSDVGHQHSWEEVADKPSTYPPEPHTHTPESIGAAPASHSHPEYATTSDMQSRTPEIQVVSSLPSSPLPGVVYIVME